MAEEQENKEDKSDAFGEAVDCISLEQAHVLAIRHARDNPDFYGASYSGINLVWEVISLEEGEDYYDIVLSFRPAGRFRGEPGIEQFTIDKTGNIESRQMLDEPLPEPPNVTPEPPTQTRNIRVGGPIPRPGCKNCGGLIPRGYDLHRRDRPDRRYSCPYWGANVNENVAVEFCAVGHEQLFGDRTIFRCPECHKYPVCDYHFDDDCKICNACARGK